MLTEEMFVDILTLHRQGLSKRAIARKLGCSRNTVKKYLKSQKMPIYSARTAKPTKLEPFHAYLHERIEAAKPDWIPAVVLLREIKERGYTGGISMLRHYLKPYKTKIVEPVVRFETPPAKQMQIDFTSIRHGNLRIKAFVATLGYSRACYVHFFTHERVDAWQEGIIGAFEFFGGVPCEILCDNAKALIIERDAYGEGEHRWHSTMKQLAKDYAVTFKACRPYRAKTKGKVERFNHYLKNSFIVPLKAELNLQGLMLDTDIANGKIGAWLRDVAHQRIHGTTGKKPQVLLDMERLSFQPLPTHVIESQFEQSISIAIAPPINLQHNLNVYDEILGSAHVIGC